MKLEDISKVREIAYKVYEVTYEHIIPRTIQENFLQLVYAPKRLEQRMSQSHFYIVEVQDEIIGFSSFSHVDTEGNCELLAMYLLEQYQGQKIGSLLLRRAINDMNGLCSITMNMEADNVNGIKFGLANNFCSVELYLDDFEGLKLLTNRMKLII
ncbi:GNAT family N-acetyltransferase [Kurthia sibirica]|uniref:GNAT family N-acetyltransferase n=2 Tax=Kurthia sibirica TaxID=202750 RepID=A0A2U3APL9_9BACL|nr:GNAT family N-acetyltransferase [Kurthia sibirica]